MVKSNGDLHILVLSVRITVPQQHHFVMMRHVIVRNRDRCRPVNGVDQPIVTVRQRAVIHPDMASAEDRDAVAVRQRSEPEMPRGISHVCVPSLLAVVNVQSMNYDVRHVLNRNAGSAGDVDTGATAVDGLEGVHDQLLFQSNDHVASEDDPKGFVLDHCVPESSRFWVDGIVVAGVGDDVDLSVTAANGVFAEPNSTVGESLPILLPIGIAPPAIVDWIPSPA